MRLTCLFSGIVKLHGLTRSHESLPSAKPPIKVKAFPKSGGVAWRADRGGSGIRKGFIFSGKLLYPCIAPPWWEKEMTGYAVTWWDASSRNSAERMKAKCWGLDVFEVGGRPAEPAGAVSSGCAISKGIGNRTRTHSPCKKASALVRNDEAGARFIVSCSQPNRMNICSCIWSDFTPSRASEASLVTKPTMTRRARCRGSDFEYC